MAFFTLHIPLDISPAVYRRLVRKRQPGVAHHKHEYIEMLNSAGFVDVSDTDVTAEFLRIKRSWFLAREQRAGALREKEGPKEFASYQDSQQSEITAIEDGLLRRSLFFARRPG